MLNIEDKNDNIITVEHHIKKLRGKEHFKNIIRDIIESKHEEKESKNKYDIESIEDIKTRKQLNK